MAGCETAGRPAGGSVQTIDEEVWAIRCITLQTSDRFERAKAYAEALKRVAGLKPDLVQVLSDEDGTAVFYGRYEREYGPDGPTERFRPNHLKDLEVIRSLAVASGTGNIWPFYLAEMDVLPTFRSQHPEWDLTQASGHWSLHVAVFYNTATMRSRRWAAEQYCAMLRQQGEPAYFHHGTVNSSVYVGTYPENAVTEVRGTEPLSGRVTASLRIVDPQMLAAQQRHPHSLQNGHTVYEVIRDRDGQIKDRIPTPSFPVVLPKDQRQGAQRKGQ